LSGFALKQKCSKGRRLRAGDITIDALILALLVDVVEAAEHFDRGNMRASIVDDTLRPMSYQVLEQLQGLLSVTSMSQK
jgi:hypothetical protein